MRVVRLAKRMHAMLDGSGASLTGGRWNSPGKQVIYTASCGALAAVEYLAHVGSMPSGLLLTLIEVPNTLEVQKVDYVPPDPIASREIGDEWLDSKAAPVLEVPSVLIPRQKNYLINPLHPLFPAIKIIESNPFAFDPRLLSSIPTP